MFTKNEQKKLERLDGILTECLSEIINAVKDNNNDQYITLSENLKAVKVIGKDMREKRDNLSSSLSKNNASLIKIDISEFRNALFSFRSFYQNEKNIISDDFEGDFLSFK